MPSLSSRLWSKLSWSRVRRSPKKGTKQRKRRRPNTSSRLFFRDATSVAGRLVWRLPVILLVAATGIYGLITGGHASRFYDLGAARLDQAVRDAGFSIQNITITGLNRVSRDAVLLALDATGKRSILSFDASTAQLRVQRLAWVKRAKVMRLFPSKLIVDIEERTPFAVWQHKGKQFLIDPDGAVITELALLPDAELPLLVGAGAPKAATALLNVLRLYPGIGKKMKAAIRVAERRWTIKLRNGIDIWLPEENIGRALNDIVQLDISHQLLSRDIVAVDLRLPDRVTLRTNARQSNKRDQQIGRPLAGGNSLGRGV